MKRFERGYCTYCGRFTPLRKDGTTFAHGGFGRTKACMVGGDKPDSLKDSIEKWAVEKITPFQEHQLEIRRWQSMACDNATDGKEATQ